LKTPALQSLAIKIPLKEKNNTMKHIKQTVTFIFILASLALGFALQPQHSAAAQVATPIPALASNTTIVLQVPTAPVKAGDEFTFPVTITTDVPTWGTQFGFSYDPALLEITSVDEGGFYQDWAGKNGASAMSMPKPKADNTKGLFPITAFFISGAKPGQGPSGNGTLAVVHAKALKDGPVMLKLGGIIVTDSGINGGNTTSLAGVKSQDGIISIGGDVIAQPTAGPVVMATLAANTQSQEAQPTIERRSAPTEAQGGSAAAIPWEIAVPAAAAVVIAVVIFIVTRMKK
jgi:hypothetical protein